jgi:bifunctional DNA-binding transcriptional regulator/antitoxin component of YhaV-PrlF toxin-antitoxin module
VTLPREFRRSLGIEDDTLLEVRLAGDRIEIRPVVVRPAAGSEWARELYALFAPVRKKARAMKEQEIDELIEGSVRETRRARNA